MRTEPLVPWTLAQRRLHWSIAACVVLAALIGPIMVLLPFEQLLLKFLLYQLHKTIGITVSALALAQIALHLHRGRPPWSPDLSPPQKRVAGIVHVLLFALILITPCLGYFTAATSPSLIPTLFLGFISVPHIVGADASAFAVVRQVHLAAALLLIALAAGHAAIAVRHHVQGRDILRRMWRGKTLSSSLD